METYAYAKQVAKTVAMALLTQGGDPDRAIAVLENLDISRYEDQDAAFICITLPAQAIREAVGALK